MPWRKLARIKRGRPLEQQGSSQESFQHAWKFCERYWWQALKTIASTAQSGAQERLFIWYFRGFSVQCHQRKVFARERLQQDWCSPSFDCRWRHQYINAEEFPPSPAWNILHHSLLATDTVVTILKQMIFRWNLTCAMRCRPAAQIIISWAL